MEVCLQETRAAIEADGRALRGFNWRTVQKGEPDNEKKPIIRPNLPYLCMKSANIGGNNGNVKFTRKLGDGEIPGNTTRWQVSWHNPPSGAKGYTVTEKVERQRRDALRAGEPDDADDAGVDTNGKAKKLQTRRATQLAHHLL